MHANPLQGFGCCWLKSVEASGKAPTVWSKYHCSGYVRVPKGTYACTNTHTNTPRYTRARVQLVRKMDESESPPTVQLTSSVAMRLGTPPRRPPLASAMCCTSWSTIVRPPGPCLLIETYLRCA